MRYGESQLTNLLAIVAVGFAALVLGTEQAQACSCVTTNKIYPPDGATVSHDMNRLFGKGVVPDTLTLVGPRGPIALGAPVYNRGLYEIVFAEPLEPLTQYRINTGINGATISTFRTSALPVYQAPAPRVFTAISAGSLAYNDTADSCNGIAGISYVPATLLADSQVGAYAVHVSDAAGHVGVEQLVGFDEAISASTMTCSSVRAFVAGSDNVCITVVAIDYRGQRNAAPRPPSARRCAIAASPPTRPKRKASTC